ncbi:type II toxin-antitoxin system VapB family antitoxin [Streptosporangium sp. NBC_01756]|uniref:type II toxin-antitoxin system VapB family antitoxin n=1 Tax=Streptosporangium sp. NBC_01756 TaxID=2975950 RepID=UPI002DD8EF15|nr:type II toxin-antitoxin system VapB family antitoxin [Streptosporangium sp. NBC_01756]WSC84266.1 type II toxin-antitoxin system VapB family antitoxin [Streptosporangium sp. NBC_01756]
MKTTVDIPDGLLREARQVARAEGTTLRSLVEEGLRSVLARRAQREGYRLPDATVGGHGLQPQAQDSSWEDIRSPVYGDRL